MKTISEEVVFGGLVTHKILPTTHIDTLSGTTPSVENVEVWKGQGIAHTITKFIRGAEGQTIRILGDGATTIANNASIKTNTGANKLLAANKVYRFTLINAVWYEDA